MKLRKQPGCWLRSSHTFKECVIAHWSSEFARKITGAKLYTEIAGCSTFNNMYLSEKHNQQDVAANSVRHYFEEYAKTIIHYSSFMIHYSLAHESY